MKASLNALHHQGHDWLRELEFYKQETDILNSRLQQVAANGNTSLLPMVEHFQNKLIMLKEQLDILRHEVNTRNHEITEISKTMPEAINDRISTGNDRLQNRLKDFTHSFADTRFEFNTFAAGNL